MTSTTKTSSDIVVIGGAMLDVIYQSLNSTTLATTMHGTSTPCKLARTALGGVGRNIAEALARLGVPVTFRTVLGGDVRVGDTEPTADANGKFLLDGMLQLSKECPNFIVDASVVAGASSPTYMALLDGRGELTAAAAVVDLFEKAFTSEVGLEVFNHVDASTVKWVIVDGNVCQSTLEGVCKGVAAINEQLASSGSSHKMRIAYDPISKTQALRSVNCLPLIDLMKPNVYEAITVGIAVVEANRAEMKKAAGGEVQSVISTKTTMETPIATDVSEVSLSLLQNVHAVLRAWEQRHATAIAGQHPTTQSAHSSRLHIAELVTFNLAADETFEGIVALASTAAKRLRADETTDGEEPSSPAPTTAAKGFSQAAALLWEVYEELPTADQELFGLLAGIYLVVVGGVGKMLCSLGEGGCWIIEKSATQTAAAASVAVRRTPCIPIPSGKLVKVTGAGDSFLAGYLCGLLKSETATSAAESATTVGWKQSERAAALAALSSLISNDTINPSIKAIVDSDGSLVL